jgi:hypothetical protein
MELTRHADMRLTVVDHTDASVFDMAGAVESLPPLVRPEAEQQPNTAVG